MKQQKGKWFFPIRVQKCPRFLFWQQVNMPLVFRSQFFIWCFNCFREADKSSRFGGDELTILQLQGFAPAPPVYHKNSPLMLRGRESQQYSQCLDRMLLNEWSPRDYFQLCPEVLWVLPSCSLHIYFSSHPNGNCFLLSKKATLGTWMNSLVMYSVKSLL